MSYLYPSRDTGLFQSLALTRATLIQWGCKSLPNAVLVKNETVEFLVVPILRAEPCTYTASLACSTSEYLRGGDVTLDGIVSHYDLIQRLSTRIEISSRVEIFNERNQADRVIVSVITTSPGTKVKKSDVKMILEQVLILPGVYIDCDTHPMAKLRGIKFLVIHSCESEKRLLEVNENTEVQVTQIISEERVRQLIKSKKPMPFPLGGLEIQRHKLRTFLRQQNTVGVLLAGPSGTGKSTLVESVCLEEKSLLLTVKCGDLLRSGVGETESEISKAFDRAYDFCGEGSTVLCFDGIDVFCPRREVASPHQIRSFTHFANLIDGLRDNLKVICLSSRPQDIESSLRRQGRLGEEITLGIPDLDKRRDIIELLMRDAISKDEKRVLAEKTPGYVGSDLALLTAHIKAQTKGYSNFQSLLRSVLREVPPSGFKDSLAQLDLRESSWSSIGGLNDVKSQLQRAIEWPIRYPEAFSRFGLKPSKGCLLYGPPGCGKTKLVRTAASQTGAVFLSASAAAIFSPYVGESEKAVAELFRRARMATPAVLFIDEIDALVSKRDGKSNGVQEKVLSTLLNEMDGISLVDNANDATKKELLEGDTNPNTEKKMLESNSNNQVIVVCATNRPGVLDAALCRPGRLDQLIYVPPPDSAARLEILKQGTSKMAVDPAVDLESLAQRLNGFSGADVENLCKEVALRAVTLRGFDTDTVLMMDFEEAAAKLKPSITQEMLESFESFAKYN